MYQVNLRKSTVCCNSSAVYVSHDSGNIGGLGITKHAVSFGPVLDGKESSVLIFYKKHLILTNLMNIFKNTGIFPHMIPVGRIPPPPFTEDPVNYFTCNVC